MTNPTEEVKLPELEVVAWSKVSKEHIPRMRMLNESYVKGVWDVPLVRLSDAQAEIAALRADAERYRWLRSGVRLRQGVAVSGQRYIDRSIHQAKMRFDFWCSPDELDAAIDAARQTTREQP